MKGKWASFFLVVLIVVNVSGFAFLIFHRFFASSPPPHAQRRIHRNLMRELDLSPEQMLAMKRFRNRFHEQSRGVRDSLCRSYKVLIDEIEAEKIDTARVDSVLDQIGTLQNVLHRRLVYGIAGRRETLTPRQRRELTEMFQHHVCSGKPRPLGPPRGLRDRHRRKGGPRHR